MNNQSGVSTFFGDNYLIFLLILMAVVYFIFNVHHRSLLFFNIYNLHS